MRYWLKVVEWRHDFLKGKNFMLKEFVRSKVIGDAKHGYGLLITLPSGDDVKYNSLFFKLEKSEKLCRLINRLGVSECHIYDVIEDSLP